MKPEAITITRSDGSRLEYDRNFFAFAVSDNGIVTTACKASKTDILVGTAWLNVLAALPLCKERRSSLRRMLRLSRYMRHWIFAFFAIYKAKAKEAHHE